MSEDNVAVEVTDEAIKVSQVTKTEQEQLDEAAGFAATGVEEVAIRFIEKSDVALRDAKVATEEFAQLMESIRNKGVLQSILVRRLPSKDEYPRYGLIDGLQRYTACKELGLDKVPCRIIQMDDGELLEAQLIANSNRVTTQPAEYSKQLLRILALNPDLTKKQLASKLSQSTTWLDKMLSLTKLTDPIQALVNSGEMKLVNAYSLAQIPEEEQGEHVQAALEEPQATFVPRMRERAKEIKDAKTKGRDAKKNEWQPQQHLQKLKVVQANYAAIESGDLDGTEIKAVLEHEGVKVDAATLKAVKTTLAWALHYDSQSQAEQKKAKDKREAAAKAEKERRKKEREEAEAKRNAERAADITQAF